MSSMLEDNIIRNKLVILIGTASLDKYHFSYGTNMKRQQVESNSILLDFIGSRYRQSVKVSIEAGELVLTNMNKSILPRFETEAKIKVHVVGLKYQEQELCI